MKYFRHAHLIYTALFAFCALTVLRLGTGTAFHVVFNIILAAWLTSSVGLMFRARWAWVGSLICMAIMWGILLFNLVAAIRHQPGHSDWLKDIVLLTVFAGLPVTLGLCGLFTTRNECWTQKQGTGHMPTTRRLAAR